jgi:hypothetical protein
MSLTTTSAAPAPKHRSSFMLTGSPEMLQAEGCSRPRYFEEMAVTMVVVCKYILKLEHFVLIRTYNLLHKSLLRLPSKIFRNRTSIYHLCQSHHSAGLPICSYFSSSSLRSTSARLRSSCGSPDVVQANKNIPVANRSITAAH